MNIARHLARTGSWLLCLGILAVVQMPQVQAEEIYDLWQVRVPYDQAAGWERASSRSTVPLQHYNVRQGDTLWRIARDYKVDLKLLMAVNKITKPELLQAGSTIIIPLEQGGAAGSGEAKLASRGMFSLSWPILGTVTSGFGWRKKEFHHGLDIAANKGETIRAIEAGKVIFAGWKNNVYGYTVIVDHGGNLKSLYAHNSKNLVKTGDWVKAGQPLALIGSTGRTTGPHVHLEIHVNDQAVDPKRYLTKR